MKISLDNIRISIAGAKLSHLVQKDRIWDHGSMAEQARIIFYQVQKARSSGNIESLKKQCTISCFKKIKAEMDNEKSKEPLLKNLNVKELAVIDVQPGKNNKPDMFTALIKGISKSETAGNDDENKFSAKCSFVRQGEWWLLDEMKIRNFFKIEY
jgi:predicted lipid-binding transport protein (Tim44 family)